MAGITRSDPPVYYDVVAPKDRWGGGRSGGRPGLGRPWLVAGPWRRSSIVLSDHRRRPAGLGACLRRSRVSGRGARLAGVGAQRAGAFGCARRRDRLPRARRPAGDARRPGGADDAFDVGRLRLAGCWRPMATRSPPWSPRHPPRPATSRRWRRSSSAADFVEVKALELTCACGWTSTGGPNGARDRARRSSAPARAFRAKARNLHRHVATDRAAFDLPATERRRQPDQGLRHFGLSRQAGADRHRRARHRPFARGRRAR